MEKRKAVWNLVLILGLVLVAVTVFFLLKPKPAKPTKEVEAPVQVKESVLADFKEPNELQVTPYKANNVEGKINIVNDFLELSYLNDQKKRDLFAFYFPMERSISNVKALILKVRIQPGTYFTVDVTVNGQLLSPRPINYYKGTGEWEELSIPIGGTLNSFSLSIGEPSDKETQKDYKVEIDWIKVVE